jgi:hypothetical protein
MFGAILGVESGVKFHTNPNPSKNTPQIKKFIFHRNSIRILFELKKRKNTMPSRGVTGPGGGGLPSLSSTPSDIQTKIGKIETKIKEYEDEIAEAKKAKNKNKEEKAQNVRFWVGKIDTLQKRLIGLEQDARDARQDARDARQDAQQNPQNQGILFNLIYCLCFSCLFLFKYFYCLLSFFKLNVFQKNRAHAWYGFINLYLHCRYAHKYMV